MKPSNEQTGRVYEYVNEDGVTFWSLTKLPFVVNPAQVLRISSRVGTELNNYVFELRRLRKLLSLPEDPDLAAEEDPR